MNLLWISVVAAPHTAVPEAIAAMVALANKLDAGVRLDANGLIFLARPGDCTEMLVETWERLDPEVHGVIVSTETGLRIAS